jgi:hypothetical protein
MSYHKKINKVECDIINLLNCSENGSHWTAYYRNNGRNYYFDSYRNAPSPKEPIKYFGPKYLYYNSKKIQNYNDPAICGHLCLIVLQKVSKGENYKRVLKELLKTNLKSFSI